MFAVGMARDESPLVVALSEAVEIRTAQRDRAATLLDRLDRIIPRKSQLDPYEQATIREVEALLVECGVRKAREERTWVDRVCICTKLADGTNASNVNPACVLHGQRL